jgi:2-iminobutanoate/2-iminopropanoate deaminase
VTYDVCTTKDNAGIPWCAVEATEAGAFSDSQWENCNKKVCTWSGNTSLYTGVKSIQTSGAPVPVGPNSQATVYHGAVLFVSGQYLPPDNGEGVEVQARKALQYINATLTSAKTNLNRVLQTNVMMANLTDMEAINKEYLAFFGDHRPAASYYAVAGLPSGAKVAIEAVAGVIED